MAFDDDLLALEQRVLNDAAGDFLAAVAELRTMLAMGASGVQRRLQQIAIIDFDTIIANGILDAHDLGATQGLKDLARVPDLEAGAVNAARSAVNAADTAALIAPAVGLSSVVANGVATGITLISSGAQTDEALAPVFGAANTVKGVVTEQVNQAGNQAVRTAAASAGEKLVWQAERDACVFCLALAGKVVSVGEVFPDADLYAPQPKSYGLILEPPRHRNCRCTLAVLFDPGYALSLEREAQRSILRGYSLRSESQPVRIRAAARLLATGPDAPKSVIAYARKAVKEGKFPRGRDVPGGSPRLVVNG